MPLGLPPPSSFRPAATRSRDSDIKHLLSRRKEGDGVSLVLTHNTVEMTEPIPIPEESCLRWIRWSSVVCGLNLRIRSKLCLAIRKGVIRQFLIPDFSEVRMESRLGIPEIGPSLGRGR